MDNRFLYGAYAEIAAARNVASETAATTPIYVGTAPVQTVAGGAETLNTPILLNNFADCVNKLGYSENWGMYTLCEAMYAHFYLDGIGPIVVINVLDPKKHVPSSTRTGTTAQTPANGRITIPDAEAIILDSVEVTGKTLGEDYTIAYDWQTQSISIVQTQADSLGSAELTINYDLVDPTTVKTSDVIGASDGEGINTGVYAVMNVYQATGYKPTLLLAPGWAEQKVVHDALINVSDAINGHWHADVYSDIPLTDLEDTPVTLSSAVEWKQENGYNKPNEKVHFPLITGNDGHRYHLSVRDCVNKQKIDRESNGVPYNTASNTTLTDASGLYFDDKQRFVDDETLNQMLCKNGITTAAYIGGRWVLWGSRMANYEYGATDAASAADTQHMMLAYLCNTFQERRAIEVDKPMTRARLNAIAFDEQAYLDSLVSIGALLYGKIELMMDQDSTSDVLSGDFKYKIEVTTVPLAKSLTAYVSWTDAGLATYLAEEGV